MKKFGLAYDDLRAVRPDIILCEFSSYGESGPLAHIGANDLALQAHSGLMSITGEADRPPVRCGTSIIDLHASLALVIAMMAALIHRQQTGEGQVVDTSLLRSLGAPHELLLRRVLGEGRDPQGAWARPTT